MAKRKGEQQYMPGTAPVKNAKVHAAAVNYAEYRDARMAAGRDEKEAHETLMLAMSDAGLTSYEFGDVRVDVNESRKCKVKIAGSAPSDDDE